MKISGIKKEVVILFALAVVLAAIPVARMLSSRPVAERNIAHVKAQASGRVWEPRRMRIRLIPQDRIVIEAPERYGHLGHLKFDAAGAMYCLASTGENQKVILKIDQESRRQHQIPLARWIDTADVLDFDVDSRGTICASLEKPDLQASLLVVDVEHGKANLINTPRFIPFRVAFDRTGRIWTVGSSGFNLQRGFLGEFQMRVYARDGKLLRIPAGGFASDDAMRGSFTEAKDSEMAFVSGEHRQLYCFFENGEVRAFVYPLAGPCEKGGCLLLGISAVGEMKYWYGLYQDTQQKGMYEASFLAITDDRNRALTDEIELPPSYRNLAGIDRQGNLYFYQQDGIGRARLVCEPGG